MTEPDREDSQSRLVSIRLRYQQIQPLFTGETVVANRLPEGAVLVDIYECPELREHHFVFRHPSFDVVSTGEEIPSFELEYQPVGEVGGQE